MMGAEGVYGDVASKAVGWVREEVSSVAALGQMQKVPVSDLETRIEVRKRCRLRVTSEDIERDDGVRGRRSFEDLVDGTYDFGPWAESAEKIDGCLGDNGGVANQVDER
ncbi:MAG: hypothetical protein R3E97_17120 [Candidatus Eisenbacteria bacterium]